MPDLRRWAFEISPRDLLCYICVHPRPSVVCLFSCCSFVSIRGFDHPFCVFSAKLSSRAFPLAELVYQHRRNDEHPNCDLENERIYPQEISPIP